MCSGSKRQVTSSGVFMEGDCNTHKQEEGFCKNSSILLELSAVDDLVSFKRVVQEEGYDVDEPSSWYGRRIGSKKIGFEERTPLIIAAMFGSKDVLSYILQTGSVDVNRSCGSDGATALHCAAASGSCQSREIVKLLLDASADINRVDANGSRPCDVIALCPSSSSQSRKILEIMLKGEVDEASCALDQVIDKQPVVSDVPQLSNESNRTEKKEYPFDPSLPDIKNGICSTDEFRMYAFKVRPCSRAYSHDWTECPFVHPGENARRRDPRKYPYSCVPCPEFRKGACIKGDACEYAHGIFECWLHPAQYRTRLCKDETNCPRRVCFFAHKPEELRPLYASTGSAVPSPRSMSTIGASPFDMASLALGSSSVLLHSTSTPPALQLPGSRLRTSLNARNVGLESEFLGIENQRRMQQLASLSSPSTSRWSTSLMSNGEPGFGGGGFVNPASLYDVFGCVEPAILSQSPTGRQIRHNINQQLRSTYPSALLSSRSAASAKRSQSFIDRGAVNRLSGLSAPAPPSQLSDWGGKLDWGIQGEELNKLRKSASFGFRVASVASGANSMGSSVAGPDETAVNSDQLISFDEKLKQRHLYRLNSGGSEMIPSWAEQLYMEQEQMVA